MLNFWKKSFVTDNQYGFRNNRSTNVALFIEQINKLVDRKKIIIGLFIDLKKAFDTIDMTTKYYYKNWNIMEFEELFIIGYIII